MVFQNDILAGAAGQGGGYTIDQSIRFNDDDSPGLTRTVGTATSRQTMTFSFWMKRSKIELSASQKLIVANGSSDDQMEFYYTGGWAYKIRFYLAGTSGGVVTSNALLRDPSAWYHIVVAIDTTQATASDRVKIYYNGELQTDLYESTYPSLNYQTLGYNNSGAALGIGVRSWSTPANFFDGYFAEINFIDGQALDPTSFGETNEDTGQWVPIKYTGTYGNEGYYITGADSADLGADYSGNGNDFTSSGLAAADQMLDTPTNNFWTLTPLDSNSTLANGNLQNKGGSSKNTHAPAFPTTGKWYVEINCNDINTGTAGAHFFGICDASVNYNENFTNHAAISAGQQRGGQLKKDNSNTTTGTAVNDGDIIALAFDADNLTLDLYVNNSQSGSQITGLTDVQYKLWIQDGASVTDMQVNFGQTGGFTYTPPTGFNALSTANLDDPTIADGSEYFHPQLYTGTGSSGLAITNEASAGDFKPDLLWLSPRSNGDNKVFFDSVRGTTQRIKSNSSDAEDTDGTAQITFETDGFDLDTTDPNFNGSGNTYVAWQWHTTGGTTSSNTDGDITSTVSANTTSGVSVLTYTGNGSDNQTIGHGIGIAPKMIITKRRDSAGNWTTYHDAVGINKVFYLNSTAAPSSNTEQYRAVPTSSVYTVGVGGDINSSGGTYVSFVFAEVEGFSKIGSYTGNGSTDGPFVYTGFKPRWVMIKRYDSSESWPILDTARGSGNFGSDAGSGGTNPTAGNDLNAVLVANTAAAEEDNPAGSRRASYLSNGFKVRTTNTAMNASGGDYLYMAFAESPFKTATAR